jgi:hypothetical protein
MKNTYRRFVHPLIYTRTDQVPQLFPVVHAARMQVTYETLEFWHEVFFQTIQNVCGLRGSSSSVATKCLIHSTDNQLHLSVRLFYSVQMVDRRVEWAIYEMRKPRENLPLESFVAFQGRRLVNSKNLTSSMWAILRRIVEIALIPSWILVVSHIFCLRQKNSENFYGIKASYHTSPSISFRN